MMTIPPEGNQPPSLSTLLRMTFAKWYGDNIPRHAAALAFYTLFAIAPLVLLATTIMGAIVGNDNAETTLVEQVEQYIHSPETAKLVQTILDNTLPSSSPWWITVAAIIALIYGASSVFGELRLVLNQIWGAPLPPQGDLWDIIWGRLLAVAMVVLSGLMIFFALVIGTWSTGLRHWATNQLHTGGGGVELSYVVVLFVVLTLAFILIYKFVPNVAIAWHDVMIGAVATAFLISIARLVITLYLSHSRVGLIFGGAGSLVIMLLWVYYSVQIFFLGAEFTYVYSHMYGKRWHLPVLDPVLTPPPEAADAVESTPDLDEEAVEVITAEINALKPLALEPDEPVSVAVSNEVPKAKKKRFRLPRPPQVRHRITTMQTRLAQIRALPITLTRPIREIVVAIGVIGALSLAALLGIPWRKRRLDQPVPPSTDSTSKI